MCPTDGPKSLLSNSKLTLSFKLFLTYLRNTINGYYFEHQEAAETLNSVANYVTLK